MGNLTVNERYLIVGILALLVMGALVKYYRHQDRVRPDYPSPAGFAGEMASPESGGARLSRGEAASE